MDTLNSFYIWVKVSCVVDFVLEKDACYFVPDKLLRLNGVVVSIQIVILQAACNNRQLEVSSEWQPLV